MSNKPFTTGQCLCGAITYTINDEPQFMGQCHCKHCQRSSGTGHMSMAMFSEDDVNINGESTSFSITTDSGNINTRHFCPTCGSRVFTRNSGFPGMIAIAVGCADDSSWFSPSMVVYTKRREAWDVTSEDVPNFEEMPPPLK